MSMFVAGPPGDTGATGPVGADGDQGSQGRDAFQTKLTFYINIE